MSCFYDIFSVVGKIFINALALAIYTSREKSAKMGQPQVTC